MDIKKEYCFAGQVWSQTEEEQLKKEYTIDKLNLMELSKIHKRLPRGITSRLKKLNLISFANETRGYSANLASDLYKIISTNKTERNQEQVAENQTILTSTLVKQPKRRLSNEIHSLREELKEIKQYMKEVHSLMNKIYEFETQETQQEEMKEMPTTPTENAFARMMKPKIEPPFTPDYYVYTDGACSNNGQESAVAGIGIYFAVNDPRNVSQKMEGKQTNNTAELGAILNTYPIIEADILSGKKITIVSDSQYAIRCATTYGEKCTSQGWNKDIPNKELVKEVYNLYKDKFNVKFIQSNREKYMYFTREITEYLLTFP
jgi:ribonuclease HI